MELNKNELDKLGGTFQEPEVVEQPIPIHIEPPQQMPQLPEEFKEIALLEAGDIRLHLGSNSINSIKLADKIKELFELVNSKRKQPEEIKKKEKRGGNMYG